MLEVLGRWEKSSFLMPQLSPVSLPGCPPSWVLVETQLLETVSVLEEAWRVTASNPAAHDGGQLPAGFLSKPPSWQQLQSQTSHGPWAVPGDGKYSAYMHN